MNDKHPTVDNAVKPAKPGLTHPPPPTTTMPSFTSTRNVSGPLAVDTANMPSETNGFTHAVSSGNAGVSPWQRSNPHTAPANTKTSQYIDKLTQENERLRRELNAEKLAREDETKRASAAQSRVHEIQAESQHLQYMADTSARTIERRDRKIEELKGALDIERNRRQVTDNKANEALGMLGNIRSETQKELAMAHEMRHRAEANADASRDSYRRIMDRFEKQINSMREELKELRRQRDDAEDRIRRLGIIHDQLQGEMNRRLHTESSMTNLMGQYKQENEKEMNGLVKEAERLRIAVPVKEKEADALVDAMKETRDKMKWVMAQSKRSGPTHN